jgi:hypothetical protein
MRKRILNLAVASAKAGGIRLRWCLISIDKNSEIDKICCAERAGYGAMLKFLNCAPCAQ